MPTLEAYKFLSEKHVDDFVSKGVLRLGAAREFRGIEGSGGRGDTNELATTWNVDGKFELKPDDPFFTATMQRPFGCNAPKVVIAGGSGTFMPFVADALLYCASSEITPAIIERMKAEFNADACVKISDFDEFVKLVANHPDVKAASWEVFHVKYIDSKTVKRFTGLDPSEKEEAFSWQKEIRGVFQLNPAPKEGRLVSVPAAVPLLTRVF